MIFRGPRLLRRLKCCHSKRTKSRRSHSKEGEFLVSFFSFWLLNRLDIISPKTSTTRWKSLACIHMHKWICYKLQSAPLVGAEVSNQLCQTLLRNGLSILTWDTTVSQEWIRQHQEAIHHHAPNIWHTMTSLKFGKLVLYDKTKCT